MYVRKQLWVLLFSYVITYQIYEEKIYLWTYNILATLITRQNAHWMYWNVNCTLRLSQSSLKKTVYTTHAILN